MKMTKLTTAIALATVAASGSAVANDVSTALANGTFTGEAFGGYTNVDYDNGSSDSEQSDWNFHSLRLGYTADVKENVQLGIEFEYDPERDASGNNNGVDVRDLYGAKTKGNWTITVGRFKQIFDPEAAVEQSDALFNGVFNGNSVLDQSSANDLLESTAAMRRIDGIEGRYSDDTGLHGSLAIYKGGVETDDDEVERDHGYSASIGLNAGDSDLAFGGTLSYFMENGDSDKVTDDSVETSGYKVTTHLATGPVIATLSYHDVEIENEVAGSTTDTDLDGFMFYGAWNISGAARSFNEFGVLQGPQVAAGDKAYELVVSYGQVDEEIGSSDEEYDGFGIGVNTYCGEYTKFYLSYQTAESDEADQEADVIQLGSRIRF